MKGDDAKEQASSLVSPRPGRRGLRRAREGPLAGPTAAGGGDLGTLARGDLSPDLAEGGVRAGPAGGVSDPIAQGGSYRILKVVERKDGSVVPFAEAKEEITRRSAQSRMTSAYEEYVAGLRKTALVDLKVREVPLPVDLPVGPGLEAPTVGAVGGLPPAPSAGAPPGASHP